MKVSELRPNLNNVDVKVKVVGVSEPREVTSRKDGKTHTLQEVKVADESGSVTLTLWNADVGTLKEGEVVEIKNAYTSVVRGSLRLNVGKRTTIEHMEEEVEVNTDNDVSERKLPPRKRFRFPRPKNF